jgi:hypothetical protein
MEADSRQNAQNQYIALFLVILGLAFAFIGCLYKFSELTTAAVGVVGMGGGMLTSQHNSNTLRAGRTITVASPDPTA